MIDRNQTAGVEASGGESPMRVLVVDDLDLNRELLSDMLAEADCQVRSAGDGQAGLALITTWRPHLVFLDMHMPVMDGLTLLRTLRRSPDPVLARQPVVALTASTAPDEQAAIRAAGADGMLGKPFTYSSLLALVERWRPPPA
jgi:CheY-like chemotaxis protein